MAAIIIGAPSVTQGKDPGSPIFADLVAITGPDATPGYATGGEAVDTLIKAQIGTGRTILTVIQVGGDPVNTWHTKYDVTNGKLLFYTEDEAEVVATTNLVTFAAVDHLVISY